MSNPLRQARRNRWKRMRKEMEIRRRAYEIVLSNGETLIVHEPDWDHFGTFLNALPSLAALGEAMDNAKKSMQGITGLPTEIPANILDGVFPLFACMTTWQGTDKPLTIEEFKSIPPLQGGWAVLAALGEFIPKNLKAAPATSSE